jgi:aminopeptidase-like protein
VFDWEIPREWNIRDAWVADANGAASSTSAPTTCTWSTTRRRCDRTMTLDELKPHLHSLPDQPDWIPYRTSYYREQLGLLPAAPRPRGSSAPGPYRVVVDSDAAPGT